MPHPPPGVACDVQEKAAAAGAMEPTANGAISGKAAAAGTLLADGKDEDVLF